MASWWCRYLVPGGGVLLDPLAGSGTIFQAGLDEGASGVVGIEREAGDLDHMRDRIGQG